MMSTSLTIGFLTPYSGIYPHYAPHLFTGWLLGMGLDPVRQQTIRFVQEYTQMGGMAQSEAAAQKMLFFNRVDVLSGLISYKAIPGIIPMVERDGKPAFFFDMGEYVPHFPHLSPDIFYASHQLWQSQYALGQWAQQRYGNGGHMVMPVYEAGYHLNSSFQQGVAAAGGTQLQISVLPFDPGEPHRMEVDELFARLAREAPPYVHAVFAGSMGNRFLQKWISSGLYRKIPLLVNETLAYDDVLEDVRHIDFEIYTTRQWMREDENRINQRFVKQFEAIARQSANFYALMGYEAGMIWREVLPHALKRDWDTVKSQLRTGIINGPRGERNFYPASGFALPVTNIVKVQTSGNKIHKIVVDQGKGMRFDAGELEVIHNESVSGWQNPFLCI